jgi:alginate O-acetyltransferase complex protein AlgJ
MEPRSIRRSRRFLALAFVAVLAAGFLSSLTAVGDPAVEEELRRLARDSGPQDYEEGAPPPAALLDGSLSAAFQSGLEASLPFRESAITLWSAARYALFHSGAPGVVVGRDGWLFTAEEFEVPNEYDEVFEERLERIIAVGDELQGKDIGLVVALIPSKARVQAGRLAGARPPAVLHRRYGQTLERLEAAGIPARDLREPLEGADSFLARDTHWSPEGARRAAEALAPAIRQELEQRGHRPQLFEVNPAEPVLHTGDLMRYLPLGPFADSFGLDPEAVQPQVSTPATGESADPLELFATPSIPVALIGTSYSADPLWSFHAYLQYFARAEVLPGAEAGRGPFEPMDAYLSSPTIVETPPLVVVWEIPERYLTVN